MKLLVLSVIFAISAAAPQIFQGRQDASFGSSLGNYLLPNADFQHGTCQPRTIYQTSTQYKTNNVYTTLYKQNVRYLTQTVQSTISVPTTLYSNIVNTVTVPSTVYQTQVNTRTVVNTQTSYKTVGGGVRYVTVTQTQVVPQIKVQTVFNTKVQNIPTTIYSTVVSSQVIPRPVFSTVYRTQILTKQVQLPGKTNYETKVRYSTAYSTVVIPAQTVLLTKTNYETKSIFRTVFAKPQTNVITRTQFKNVYTTIYSQQVAYETKTQYATKTHREVKHSTIYSTVNAPQYITRTVQKPVAVTRTFVSTQIIPTTAYQTVVKTNVVTAPAQTQYVTRTHVKHETQHLPGKLTTVYQTETVHNTNYLTSTRFVTNYNTVTQTQTKVAQCNTGYNYNAPASQLAL